MPFDNDNKPIAPPAKPLFTVSVWTQHGDKGDRNDVHDEVVGCTVTDDGALYIRTENSQHVYAAGFWIEYTEIYV